MWGDQLKQYLDGKHVKYVTIAHSPAYTAQEVAAAAHVPGGEMAKTVVVKLDGKMSMAVLPASEKVAFDRLRESTGTHDAQLATEREFADLFPECERGAMPPFGNLYGLDVYVDRDLTKDEEIAFNAGSFTEVIRMKYADFARAVHPKVAKFATRT